MEAPTTIPNQSSSSSTTDTESKTVVLHPGSCYLRYGFSSDPLPHSIPHCIAKRLNLSALQKNTTDAQKLHTIDSINTSDDTSEVETYNHDRDMELIRVRRGLLLQRGLITTTINPDNENEEEEIFFEEISAVEQPMNNVEFRKYAEAPKSLITQQSSHLSFTRNCYYGDDALRAGAAFDRYFLNPAIAAQLQYTYQVCYPLIGGHFNTTRHPKQQQQQQQQQQQRFQLPQRTANDISMELELIWNFVLTEKLRMTRAEIENARIVLVVQDSFDKSEVRMMLNVLLKRIRCKSVFIHQESVCAALGAGLSSACVIDVGDSKTSVAFVEDGYILPSSKVYLPFGGLDISRSLLWTFTQCMFPLTDIDVTRSTIDREVVRKAREYFCHTNLQQVQEVYQTVHFPYYHIHNATESTTNQTTAPLSPTTTTTAAAAAATTTTAMLGSPNSSNNANMSVTAVSGTPGGIAALPKMFQFDVGDPFLIASLGLFHPSLLLPFTGCTPPLEFTKDSEDWDDEVIHSATALVKTMKSEGKYATGGRSDFIGSNHEFLSVDQAVIYSIYQSGVLSSLIGDGVISSSGKRSINLVVIGGCSLLNGFTSLLESRLNAHFEAVTAAATDSSNSNPVYTQQSATGAVISAVPQLSSVGEIIAQHKQQQQLLQQQQQQQRMAAEKKKAPAKRGKANAKKRSRSEADSEDVDEDSATMDVDGNDDSKKPKSKSRAQTAKSKASGTNGNGRGGSVLIGEQIAAVEEATNQQLRNNSGNISSVKVEVVSNFRFLQHEKELNIISEDSNLPSLEVQKYLSWKGGSLLSRLDAIKDMWITRDAYETHGIRLLRDKAPFAW